MCWTSRNRRRNLLNLSLFFWKTINSVRGYWGIATRNGRNLIIAKWGLLRMWRNNQDWSRRTVLPLFRKSTTRDTLTEGYIPTSLTISRRYRMLSNVPDFPKTNRPTETSLPWYKNSNTLIRAKTMLFTFQTGGSCTCLRPPISPGLSSMSSTTTWCLTNSKNTHNLWWWSWFLICTDLWSIENSRQSWSKTMWCIWTLKILRWR